MFLEFLRERALAMGRVMGGERAGVLRSPLNKNKWFDKRHRHYVYREICALISSINFKDSLKSFYEGDRPVQWQHVYLATHKRRCKILIRTANCTALISLIKNETLIWWMRCQDVKPTFLLRGSCVPYGVTLGCTLINSHSMFRQTKSLAFFHYPCVPRNSTSVPLQLSACTSVCVWKNALAQIIVSTYVRPQ